jgi:hypothetical protein
MRSPFLKYLVPVASLLSLSALLVTWSHAGVSEGKFHLRGRLLDKANGDGVSGASILIAGTAVGAISDSLGRFRIDGAVRSRPASARPSVRRVPASGAKPAHGGNLEITVPGLEPKTLAFPDGGKDLGDIVLDYPARRLGVGASPIYGATVLFDGSRGRAAAATRLRADWMDWPRFTPSDLRFRLVRDPARPGDTDRVALQACCDSRWGYDDIQARAGLYRDCQIHVEWIGMGEYDVPYDAPRPDPNAADPAGIGLKGYKKGYINSGVYVASRYEVQIRSWDTAAARIPGRHDMGAIVDDYAPSANRNLPNGTWQAYDITFRGARFAGTTMVSAPYMSVWWNGVLVHDNRKLTGAAAGLANHSGEEHGDTAIYGLKLQSEGRDVRFRNVWIKKLVLEAPQTNLGF